MRWPTVTDVAGLMRETVEAVVLPRYGALESADVAEKADARDLVTIADIEAEQRLTPLLQALLPGSRVLGEEAAATDPGLTDRLSGDGPVWIIDPVDGTRNFVKGSKNFCMMVALVVGGETVLGIILDPLGAYWAGSERGSGSWLQHYTGGPAQRLSVLAACPVHEMRGALNLRFLESPLKEAIRARSNERVGQHYRIGSAGHDYLRTLTGHSHFSLHARIMPWDHAAGCLLHGEAGGFQAHFDGTGYRAAHLSGGLLIAPDAGSWHRLRSALFECGRQRPT